MIDNNYTVIGAYKVIDFLSQTVTISTDNEVYYFPHVDTKCYNCIVNVSQTYDIDDLIKGKLKKYNLQKNEYEEVDKNISSVRKMYLTALGRERYDLYKTNGYF